MDQLEVLIGHSHDIEIDNKDEIDKPLEGYSISRLDKTFEKEDPWEFFNLFRKPSIFFYIILRRT